MKPVLILAPFLGLAFALDGDIGASDADSATCVSKGGSCDAKAGPTGDEVHLMQLLMQRKPATTWSYKPLQWIPNLSSRFNITQCATIKNDGGSLLPANVRASLATDNKTQCVQVFGVLIAGTAGAETNAMKLSANIIAQLLDTNCDGKVDDPNISAKMDMFNTPEPGWINYGTDSNSEHSTQDPLINSFSSQVWKAQGSNEDKPSICLEEAFHMVHQQGWSKVYPNVFGYKEWGHDQQSVACRCMREAQCNWYQHPENGGCVAINGTKCYNKQLQDVFKNGTLPGTCSMGDCADPSCDCLEFTHKVITTWLGNAFNGYERMGPKLEELKAQGNNQRQAVEKLLTQSTQCSKLLLNLKDPKFALPKQRIKEEYTCAR